MMKKVLALATVTFFSVCTAAVAQSSMAGKTCLGTFTTAQATPDVKWSMGAVRITFTTASAGTLEFAGGADAFRNPEKAPSFESKSPFSNAAFVGNRLTLSGGPSKMDVTGDGTTFSGTNDPRPTRPLVGNIKMSCK